MRYYNIITGLECLQSNGQNFMQRNYTGGRQSVIPRGSQALIPSYRFDCNGNIKEWLVSVASSPTVGLIEIELQVWRPLNKTGLCFNKIGGNIFTVSSTVPVANFIPTEQIKFQSGDVVGFRLLNPSQVQTPVTENSDKGDSRSGDSRSGDRNQDQGEREDSHRSDDDNKDKESGNGRDGGDDDRDDDDEDDDDDDGVVILNEVDNIKQSEEVWFSRIGDTMTSLERDFDECALSIGSNGMLTTFTNAAPLISASVLVAEENLQVPQSVTASTSTPLELSPVTAEEGTVDVVILVSATVPAILIILAIIVAVAVACTCHWVKRRRKITNDNRSMPTVNDNEGHRTIIVPTVYRRQTIQNQINVNVEPQVHIIALIPHGHNRAQQSNGSAELVLSFSTSRELEDRSTARPSEANMHTMRNEPIVMERNESYGKLETTSTADSDADYYDYPNHIVY
jgi:hypothetical protein